ncbi:MAG: hypothetical protein MH137_11325 [Flavobacteriales bacterium]|nr:hypothetical protein [Flavobacteriales bacterium]
MKTTIISCFLFWSTICVFAQKNKVTELISYRVSIQLDTLTQPTMKDRYLSHWEFNQNWYKDKIDYARRSEFIKNLHEKVCNGKVTALSPFYELNGFTPYFEKLDPNKAKLIGTDSIFSVVYDNFPPYNAYDTVYVFHLNTDDIVQLEFMEIWTYIGGKTKSTTNQNGKNG